MREVCAAAPDRSATGSLKLCFDLVVNQAQEPVTDRKEVTAVPAVEAAVRALTTSRDGYQLTSPAGSA